MVFGLIAPLIYGGGKVLKHRKGIELDADGSYIMSIPGVVVIRSVLFVLNLRSL